ncbi:MAG: hypothetical protein K1Y01_01605 [Vicinamibacteria bacterium]|nr:hypothetical protein [Vicinamibacteria bacterium]
MNSVRSAVMMVILAGIAAVLLMPPLVSRHFGSVASLAWGTDDAFVAEGLEPRENQVGGGAIRWTRPRAAFVFADAGPGLVDIDLEVRDHRTEVNVTVNGAVVGTLVPGQRRFASQTRLGGASMVLGIETEGFAASSRTLGTQFVSLRVEPAAALSRGAAGVPVRLWVALGAILLVSTGAQILAGQSAWIALVPPVLFTAMILPAGLWRSGWLVECAVLMSAASLISALVPRATFGTLFARGCLQVALLLALTVHGLLPPSPLVIQGDAQLHGNKLAEVARGNRFPISRTDHKKPFEFPYGFSFYATLSPFVSPEVQNVRIVREGAAFFWSLSILGLALVLGRASAGLAAGSVLLWTFAPVNIRTMGFGNLNNVFAQAIFVLFLAAAATPLRGKLKGLALAFLVALSATAHLSSFIVLVTLLLLTLASPGDRRGPAFKPLLLGVAAAGLYFATFLPMILAQVPRILGERGGSSGVFDPWRLPRQVMAGAGWPVLALVVLALLVCRVRPVLPLARSLALTGLLLGVVALVSPIEVRYLLAVLPLLAVVGAAPFDEEDPRSFPRQNLAAVFDFRWLRTLGREGVRLPLALALLLAAIVHGGLVLFEFLPLSGV